MLLLFVRLSPSIYNLLARVPPSFLPVPNPRLPPSRLPHAFQGLQGAEADSEAALSRGKLLSNDGGVP